MKQRPVQKIAHYRVIEPIGAGGMGAVYKAYDDKLQRVVALKLLAPEYVSQDDRRRRFFQEARAASQLNHPHILIIYDVGEENGHPYIAMEYVEGETLRQKIKSNGLQLKETLEIAIQIAAGLARAHDLGIIHRDLKPENLMLNRDGYAKILDFGLAKLVAERERALVADSEQKTLIRGVQTESGTLMGTVNYMAPEQLLGQRVDRRCDIFSFGVVLCEMLTGRAPFVHDNRIDTMHAILHRDPQLPGEGRAELPFDLQRIISTALAKAPKDRYQTIAELAEDLRSLKRDLDLGKTLPAAPRTRLVLKRMAPTSGGIDYDKELNEAQYKAVTTTDGPLLIVAGAGTGKTRTLVYRVARLVEIGVKPESILLLTFTRRAASSMLTRAAALADARCQRVSGGTFHSLGHAVLRKFAEEAGVSRNFTVLDQSDTEDLIDLLRRQIRITKAQHFPRKRTIAAIFSMMVNKVQTLKQVLNQQYPQFIDERRSLETLFKTFEEFRDLEHLQAIAKRYKTPAKLLDDIALDPTEAIQENMPRRGSGFVTLSTVHSAKGLEWDNVFLIWMTDGGFPSSRFQDEFDDFEEERRLLYVATTRARRELHYVYPAVDVYRGPETEGAPTLSRFLDPIPPTILPHASLTG